MKNNERIIYGLLITTVVFLTANIIGSKLHLVNNYIPYSFITHTIMLLLSVLVIRALRKNLSYRISIPKIKTIINPVFYGIVITIGINILMTIISKIAGRNIEAHPLFSKMSPLQVLIFIFFYASVAEEMLFRGFLMNLLKPLRLHGVTVFRRKVTLPVIISALAFGTAHLILIAAGVSPFFLIRIVVFAMCLGLLAGYYQEKYDNNFHAIIIHMAGNSIAVITAFLMI